MRESVAYKRESIRTRVLLSLLYTGSISSIKLDWKKLLIDGMMNLQSNWPKYMTMEPERRRMLEESRSWAWFYVTQSTIKRRRTVGSLRGILEKNRT